MQTRANVIYKSMLETTGFFPINGMLKHQASLHKSFSFYAQ